MFSFFSKNKYDLDGTSFKNQFKSTKNAVLLDVRTANEYKGGSIPGSKNIDCTASDFQSKVQKLDPDKTYFLFCRSGGRSGNASKLMEKLGFKSFNLIGGIGSWPKQ
jgi:rhodanese-related sulfurtransferase